MMKFVALMRDSLRETIDSKVFFVVLAISLLFIGLMATLSLTPNAPDQAMQKLIDKLPDGAEKVTLPILGELNATPPRTKYSIADLKGPEGAKRPWEGEYTFTIESRDEEPSGGRIAILFDLIKTEEATAMNEGGLRNTRAGRFRDDIKREAERIQAAEERKGGDRMAVQQRMAEQIIGYITTRLQAELQSLSRQDMENFIRDHLQTQGNWDVKDVTFIDLPENERVIKIEARVPIKEGEDIRIVKKEVDGEVNKFRVTVKSKDDTFRLWPHKASLLFGALPLGSSKKPSELVYTIIYWGVTLVGSSVIMLLSCVITAFYIPNMLRKGTVDMLLAKPINRFALLLYKYIGGLTFMFVNTAVLIVGLWIALGLTSGVWEPLFLVSILTLTFEFAFFYALSTLAAVVTRSPIVSILLCVVAWGVLFVLGWAHVAATALKGPEGGEGLVTGWLATSADVIHTVAPHYLDLDWVDDRMLQERLLAKTTAERESMVKKYEKYTWTESLLVTGLYIAVMLGFACWRFSAKDY